MRTSAMWFTMAGHADASMEADLRVAAVAESARDARHLIMRLCERHGVDPRHTLDIALAVTEAVTNAIVHAYPDGAGDIDVYGEVRDGELLAVIRDYGVGPGNVPRHPGLGAGIEIMNALADACELHPGCPGTRVRLRFRLAG